MHLMMLPALSASLESAEKKDVDAPHGEGANELNNDNKCYYHHDSS